ncbi:hypothetical protein [Arthrobacter sp. A5]|uniref:hypothetical protein n=1 Tax=Arthrobacter sp. A5 TaxID=576926 RepID=UPI003DA7AB8B
MVWNQAIAGVSQQGAEVTGQKIHSGTLDIATIHHRVAAVPSYPAGDWWTIRPRRERLAGSATAVGRLFIPEPFGFGRRAANAHRCRPLAHLACTRKNRLQYASTITGLSSILMRDTA